MAKTGTRDKASKGTGCKVFSIPLGIIQTPLHCEPFWRNRGREQGGSGAGPELDLNCRRTSLAGLSQAAYIIYLGFTECPMGRRRIIKSASRKA